MKTKIYKEQKSNKDMKKEQIVCRGCGIIQDLKITNIEKELRASEKLISLKRRFCELRRELKESNWFKRMFFQIDTDGYLEDVFLRKGSFSCWLFNKEFEVWEELWRLGREGSSFHECRCGYKTGLKFAEVVKGGDEKK